MIERNHHHGLLYPTKNRERNREVPFPTDAMSETVSDLEYKLFDHLYGDFISYENKPSKITSGAVEAYANWLQKLTQCDSEGKERSTFLYYHIPGKSIIFPPNPTIGTGKNVSFKGVMNRKVIPLMQVHSHPDPSSFSEDDLQNVIQDRGISEAFQSASLVATPRRNFLLLRTKETVPQKLDVLEEIFDETSEKANKVVKTTIKKVENERLLPLKRNAFQTEITSEYDTHARQLIGLHPSWYYTLFYQNALLAERYKLAFYQSKKDGVYTHVTPDSVLEECNKTFTAAAEKTATNYRSSRDYTPQQIPVFTYLGTYGEATIPFKG